jgi:hypothetical protein
MARYAVTAVALLAARALAQGNLPTVSTPPSLTVCECLSSRAGRSELIGLQASLLVSTSLAALHLVNPHHVNELSC